MGSRSGPLECLHARHMDGRTDIRTGKVNLTANRLLYLLNVFTDINVSSIYYQLQLQYIQTQT